MVRASECDWNALFATAASVRRMVKLEGERRNLLDAHDAGAIDIVFLRAEQQRIGGELRAAEQRLTVVDATVSSGTRSWRALCGSRQTAGRPTRSQPKTRRLFNQAVFDRIEVCARNLTGVSYQALFDLLFGTGEFEYETVVAGRSQLRTLRSCGRA
jgi:hypothetical protein